MIGFVAAIFVTALPERYRANWMRFYGFFTAGAIAGGIIESLVSLGFFILNYFAIFGVRANQLTEIILNGRLGVTSLHLNGAHLSAMMEYLFRPSSLALIYCSLEGGVRSIAALAAGDIVPVLPMAALAWIHGAVARNRAEAQYGPPIADEVQVGPEPDFVVRIASRRPKLDWNRLLTIRYQDRLYEVAGEEKGPRPRPFIYHLKPRPESKIIRGICHYSPEVAAE